MEQSPGSQGKQEGLAVKFLHFEWDIPDGQRHGRASEKGIRISVTHDSSHLDGSAKWMHL